MYEKARKLVKRHFARGHLRPCILCGISWYVFFEKDGKIFIGGEEVIGENHECIGYRWIFDLMAKGYKLIACYSCKEWWWHRREYSPHGTDTDFHGRPYIEVHYNGYDELCEFMDGRTARYKFSIRMDTDEEIIHEKYNWHLFEKLMKNAKPIEKYWREA